MVAEASIAEIEEPIGMVEPDGIQRGSRNEISARMIHCGAPVGTFEGVVAPDLETHALRADRGDLADVHTGRQSPLSEQDDTALIG
jgi:hypothetical protein